MTSLENNISQILEHYHHTLKVANNLVTIEASKKSNQSIRLKIVLLCLLLVAGILVYLFYHRKGGGALIALAVVSLISVMNVFQREAEAKKRVVNIGVDYIEVTEKFRRERIQFDDIEEFQINTKMENRFAVGSIIILDKKRLPLQVVELIGKDEAEISKDLEQIAHYINEEWITKE
ncbi:MAG: hypothetical protein AAGG75_05100 [Bacteroidota bacterium]